MNSFEQGLLKFFPEATLQRIQATRIGIAGAGGLGSNIAMNLVRCGFKYFEIIDNDVVDMSNLNRQYYFYTDIGTAKVEALQEKMAQVNPSVVVQRSQVRLTTHNALEHFKDAHILFEAFDGPESKKIFLESYADSKKLLIMGNGMAGLTNEHEISIRRMRDRLYIVGDQRTHVSEKNPPFAPRVTACAGLMASVALEHVCQK